MPKPKRRPSGRYQMRFVDRTGRRHTKTFDTAAEAKAWYAGTAAAMLDGRWVNPDRGALTVNEWAAEVAAVLRPSRRANTRALNNRMYRLFVQPRWGKVPLNELRREPIRRWVADLSDPDKYQKARWDKASKTYVRDAGPLSPETIRKVYNTFRTIVQAAVDAEMILSPLPRELPLPEIVRKNERYLRDAEVKKLASCFRDRYQAMIYVCCYGGPRIGEAVALQLRDIDWGRRRIRVDAGQTEVGDVIVYEAPKTAAGMRTVPLPDVVMEQLRSHVDRFVGWDDPDAYLFRSPTERVLRIRTWRRREWYPAVAASGLERLTPHDMRHTAASLLISEGVNKWQLAAILGHKDTRMIDRVYGHLFDEDLDDVQQRMSRRAQRAHDA